jgi:hypothetical protein
MGDASYFGSFVGQLAKLRADCQSARVAVSNRHAG